jgi:hypothetical protein
MADVQAHRLKERPNAGFFPALLWRLHLYAVVLRSVAAASRRGATTTIVSIPCNRSQRRVLWPDTASAAYDAVYKAAEARPSKQGERR